MKNKLITILELTLLIFGSQLNAQYTKNEAIDKVLNVILVSDLGKINVYVDSIMLSNGDSLKLADGTIFGLPYEKNWVFFIDDHPFALWAHNSRFIFVSEVDGSYIIENQYFFPEDLSMNYEKIRQIQVPISPPLVQDSGILLQPVQSNLHKYAVIIAGEDNPIFWYTTSLVYNTLIQAYGYLKENIFVHYKNGTSEFGLHDDLDGGTL